MKILQKYLKQPSTYSGVIKLLTALGLVAFTPEQTQMVSDSAVTIVTTVIALLGVFDLTRNERLSPKKNNFSNTLNS